MDELIAKIRSRVSKDSNIQSTQEDVVVVKEEIGEITTSQTETVHKNKLKLDFETLKRHREDEKEGSLMISEVKSIDSLKIDGPLWVIIKSIEAFKGPECNVYRWEVCDESGVIFGSTTVCDSEISIGTIVCLMNFSIWRTNGNHLNIVRRNLKTVVN